eukprot:scaffold12237_cov208-Skeletonema_menzelii.AAC.4
MEPPQISEDDDKISRGRSSTGGFISGEVKLALSLRILAEGSYLDLALLFDRSSSSSHAYAILFHDVISIPLPRHVSLHLSTKNPVPYLLW